MAYLVRKSGAPNYSARKHHPSFKSLTLRCRPAKATKLAEVASDVESPEAGRKDPAEHERNMNWRSMYMRLAEERARDYVELEKVRSIITFVRVERRHVNDPVIWGAVEQIRSTEMFWKQRQIERLHCKIALLEQQLAEGKAFDPAMTEDYLWQFARELPQHVAVAADPASPATTGVALVDPLFSDDSAAAGATAAASASHDLADRVAAPVPLLSSDAGGAVNNIVPRPSPAHVAASPLGASLGSSDQSDDAGALLLLQPAMATATVPPPPRSLANAVAGAAGLFLGAATIWCATAAALNAAAQQF